MTIIDCKTLFRRYVDWYEGQVAEGRLPKRVIGLPAQGQPFELDLDAVELGPFQRDKLIRYVLETGGAAQYVYATSIRVEDEETGKVSERVLIVSATPDEYIGGDWSVTRAADGTISLKPLGEWTGNDGQTPGTWFLTDTITVEDGERPQYAALWAELQAKGTMASAG